MTYQTTQKPLKNNELSNKITPHQTTQRQARLDLSIKASKEIDGIGMGVLSDGTAYLTARGLAKLCGVEHTTILDISNTWPESVQSPKVTKIKEILYKHHKPVNDAAHYEILEKNVLTHAYPDYVCIAILEYYAFEAGQHTKTVALQNFRHLAGVALKTFIYNKVGYDPAQISNCWAPLLERMSSTAGSVPVGYFGIFKETVDLAVSLGEVGLYVDQGFIHDISVGQAWSVYWKNNNLNSKYGARITYNHEYPESFSQFYSNPQEARAYPEESLPEFRRWLREEYIRGGKLRAYLLGKTKQQGLPAITADNAISNYEARFLLN